MSSTNERQEPLQFVAADMPRGCETLSTKIAGDYLHAMLESDLFDKVLKPRGNDVRGLHKNIWKKMYLGFIRKFAGNDANMLEAINNRHAYQVLYSLSRHFGVCRVEDDKIFWTSVSKGAAYSSHLIGMLRLENHHLRTELETHTFEHPGTPLETPPRDVANEEGEM
jgi:hypothetical protein